MLRHPVRPRTRAPHQAEARRHEVLLPEWPPHQISYVESENDRLKAQLAAEQQRTAWATERAESQARALVSAEHRLRATRGVVTKIKRRVAHGVCPCCQRTFKDLARHMEGQHPDYAKDAS
jgi:hypothetical protein